jgi:hypothetical protein
MSLAGKGESHGSEFSHFGKACHDAAAQKGRTGMFDAEKIAQSYGLARIEKGMMTAYVTSIEMDFPEGTKIEDHREVSFRAQSGLIIVLSCTPDAMLPEFPDGTGPTAIDYKFGRGDVSEDTLQTPAYLLSECADAKGIRGGSSVIVHPVSGTVKQKYYSAEELRTYVKTLESIAERVMARSDDYCRGYHCDKFFCCKRATCPAYLEEVRTLMATYGNNVPVCTPEVLFRAYAMRGQLTQMATRIKDMTESHIKQHGPITVGQDILDEVIEDGREKVDPVIAMNVLTELYGADAIKAFDTSKNSVVEFVSARIKAGDATRGAIKQTLDALAKAGALSKGNQSKFVYMKKAITKETTNERQSTSSAEPATIQPANDHAVRHARRCTKRSGDKGKVRSAGAVPSCAQPTA